MSTTLATPALSAFSPRTVLADPGDNPGVSEVRPGGILVWTNRSAQFRHFAISFKDNEGRGPASPGDTLAGTGSIVMHVILEGTFDYTIQYGTVSAAAAGPVSTTFAVHSCVGC